MSNGWGSLPEVTERALLTQFTEVLPHRQEVASWFGISCSTPCCGNTRGKSSSDQEFWETGNLGWMDFQTRKATALMMARRIWKRLREAETNYERMKNEGKEEEANAMWASVTSATATEMRAHAESAKGLFVKATQQMSTMAGVLPDVYCEEFTKTTESLPVSRPEEVYSVIERNLQQDPTAVFDAFDREPVASASIGQVHKARLHDSGDIVAVKVQHDGVDRVFMEDLSTLERLAGLLKSWYPSLNLQPAVDEWKQVVPLELDFREEAKALSRASAALEKYGSPVCVPAPREEYCSQQVMVMSFIEALPITKLVSKKFCQVNRIDKDTIMNGLLEAFAVLTFREGLIHGDPHAGNIRMLLDSSKPGGAVPVIFDWGMTKSLTNEERLNLAKFFHALSNMDMNGIFDALALLGFQFGDGMTDNLQETLVEKLRAAMKDTVSKDQTRARAEKSYAAAKKKLEESPENRIDDDLIKEFPRCIIFFLRMLDCMRGLCVTCDAQGLKILEIFTSQAREAVKEASTTKSLLSTIRMFNGRDRLASTETNASGMKRRSLTSVITERNAPVDSATDSDVVSLPTFRLGSLENRVRSRCAKLGKSKALVGAQVAVVQDGRVVCDLAYGTQSTIDLRPIETSTRFPLMDAVAGIATLALLRDLREAMADEDVSLDRLVSSIWPEFGGGHSTVTLQQLLGHEAGIQDAFPVDFQPQCLNNCQFMQEHFEHASLPEATDSRYVYLLQFFLVLAIAQRKKPKLELDTADFPIANIFNWLEERLGSLGLDIVVPSGSGGEAVICRDIPSLSRVSMTEVEGADTARSDRLHSVTKAPGAKSSMLEACRDHLLTFDPLKANVSKATGSRDQLRAGFPLAASARGLATMISSTALLDELHQLDALKPACQDTSALGWFLTAGACSWTKGGLQHLEVTPAGLKSLCANTIHGYGVVSGLGTCVMNFPDLQGSSISVAITVNNILQGRKAVAELAEEVFAFYGHKPVWTHIPLRVTIEAGRMMAESKMAQSMLKEWQHMMTEGSAENKKSYVSSCLNPMSYFSCFTPS